MKIPKLRLIIAALLPLLAVTVTGYGQSAPASTTTTTTTTAGTQTEEPVKLPDFTVSATAADTYHPADTLSMARVAGALLDTPVSINVIPRQLLDDLGANSTYDASQY